MATTRTDSAPGIDPHIGRVLGGRYKVLSKLGEGGIGAVYKGLQVNLEQHVAIKIMKPEVSTDEVLVARFNNEARIYARIKSPYVVKIHDFGQEPSDKILYLVMEFLPGVDLRQMLRREGTMRASRMCGLLVQILEGLGAAHALGIVHRDVKPANIMIQGAETDSPFARILDFGVSKVDADPLDAVPADMNTQEGFEMGLTLPGAFSGTPVYMSPEQCRGAELDHRSDIYAAGVLMYEMACGQPPFSATTALALLTKHVLEAPEPPSRIASHPIPHALDDLIMRCLEKDPDNRPASVRVLIEDLQAIASDASNPDLVPLLDLSDRFTDVPLPVSTKAFGGQAQPADPSAVAVVRELLRTLGLAYKNYVTYPKDNPIFRNVAEQVCGMLDRYFESRETLDLSVDRFAVLFNKERVYEDTDLRVSYPFKLFSDGIRKLAFHRGIGQTELSAYLECLHLASSSPAHTADLVTLMWERRFEHITYHLVDDLIHEGLPEGDELAAEVAEGAIATDARYRGLARNTMPRTAMHAASGTSMEPSPAADHPTLEPMSAKELADLEMLVSEAEQRDDTDEFVRAVFEALGRADDTRETEALLKILDNVAEASLRMGDVEHLLTILNPARALLEPDVPEAIAQVLQGIITHASEPCGRPWRSSCAGPRTRWPARRSRRRWRCCRRTSSTRSSSTWIASTASGGFPPCSWRC